MPGRWYKVSDVELGKRIYEKNCRSCHGSAGKGSANWKQRLPDGSLPPPPLNGTAHTWHHSLGVLGRIIHNGGKPFGGSMPGFKDKLTEAEKTAVIASVQDLWSDEVYLLWARQRSHD